MTRLLDGIVGPNGKRLWVVSKQHITAQEANAICDWTQRVTRGLRREHSDDEYEMPGHHRRAFHAIGAFRFWMPTYGPSATFDGRVFSDSVLFGIRADEQPDLYTIVPDRTPGKSGLFLVKLGIQLPSEKYWVHVWGTPQLVANGYRYFRFDPSSRTQSSFVLEAWGNVLEAARGLYPQQVVGVIYMETRPEL